MTIQEILCNRIVPFDVEDKKITDLFSFYLHKAPTIDSKCSGPVPACGQNEIWNRFIEEIKKIIKYI